ncbi:MAG TPA: hypothetical protein PKY58_07365, partial [Syntrophales bacterium]|nr:hypothetical protein [Syntrophales bacterium]HQQ27329.1 hypothetical protein [Syntrophales bacterium]
MGAETAGTKRGSARGLFYEAVKNDEVVKRPIQHFFERQRKKFHRQGARIPRTEAYGWYAAGTREEGERSIWAF